MRRSSSSFSVPIGALFLLFAVGHGSERNLRGVQFNGNGSEPNFREVQLNGNGSEPNFREVQLNGNGSEPNSRGVQFNGNGSEPNFREVQLNGNGSEPNFREVQLNGNGSEPNFREVQLNGNGSEPNSREVQLNGNGSERNLRGVQLNNNGMTGSIAVKTPAGGGMLIHRKLIAHYLGIFDGTWEDKIRDDTPFDKMDILYIAFAHTRKGKNGNHVLGYENATGGDDKPHINELVNTVRYKNQNIKIMVSQGYGQKDYENSVKDPEGFADSVVVFIRRHRLDGIDVDFEVPNVTVEQFKAFAYALRKAIDAASEEDGRQYLLTITVDHSSFHAMDGDVANTVFDYVNVMTYWGNYALADTVINMGIPHAKIFVGCLSEVNTPDSDMAQHCFNFAEQIGAVGIFAWRLDNDTRDESSLPTYAVADGLWNLVHPNENEKPVGQHTGAVPLRNSENPSFGDEAGA